MSCYDCVITTTLYNRSVWTRTLKIILCNVVVTVIQCLKCKVYRIFFWANCNLHQHYRKNRTTMTLNQPLIKLKRFNKRIKKVICQPYRSPHMSTALDCLQFPCSLEILWGSMKLLNRSLNEKGLGSLLSSRSRLVPILLVPIFRCVLPLHRLRERNRLQAV